MDFYNLSCIAAFVMCAPLAWLTRPKSADTASAPPDFKRFQSTYLWAWCLAVGADWLQGPYVYALYSAYGFTHQEIGQLFVAGFAASFLFGTFVGSFADSFGRKRSALLYCFLYIVSCLTKHVNQYWFLMFGRLTGGIATSLLFSVFESWLVCEHTSRSYPQSLLGFTFTFMWALNYIVAVAAGVTAEFFVDAMPLKKLGESLVYVGGSTTAFDLSMFILVLTSAFLLYFWEENYGARDESSAIVSSFKNLGRGASIVFSEARVAMCAIVLALFESSMYIFVFNWTPVLSQGNASPPFGLIFSTFMICAMSGAALFQLLGLRADVALMLVLCLASIALAVPTIAGIDEAHSKINFAALCLFELSVGMYFPAISAIKSKVVREPYRVTLYSFFRMPMNAIVVVVLLVSPPLVPTFQLISCMMMTAMVVQAFFVQQRLLDADGEIVPLHMK